MSGSAAAEEFDANPSQGGFLGGAGNAAIVQLIQGRLNTMIGKSSGFVETLPPKVQARIEFLRELQDKHDEYEEQFNEELKALRAKYETLYTPLYDERKAVVTGEKEVPVDETAPKAAESEGTAAPGEAEKAEEEVPPGIPDFWLSALRANPVLADHITEKDEEVLAYLADLRCEELEEGGVDEEGDPLEGFKLSFHFAPNPFFDDVVLTKTYYIYEEDGEPLLSRAEGCTINWKPGKNTTVKVLKKKAKGKPGGGPPKMLTKREPCASFFNFFNPPKEPEEDAEMDEDELEELRGALEEDFEQGETIRSRIIPRAVRWYTGEINDDEDEDDDDDEEEGEDYEEGDDEDTEAVDAIDMRKDDEDDEDEDDDDQHGHKAQKVAEALADKGEKPPECKQQ